MPDEDRIEAMPTKAFFVNMLVRDIPLERAVLDLLDNCIDGARNVRPGDEADYAGLFVKIKMNDERFKIEDNCGGFDIRQARYYAFRFGRPDGADSTAYSIGQFGVGMKRALFKFGKFFEVKSTTENQHWSMHVDVDDWLSRENEWAFAFDEISDDREFGAEERGTTIEVRDLRSEVAARFDSEFFKRKLADMIRSHQRKFLAQGLAVEFDGRHLTASELSVRAGGDFQPAVEEFIFEPDSAAPVTVRLVVGVSDPSPLNAGWYVLCNRRVIVAADRWTIQAGERSRS
ncbi:MAG: ATP-binding protein [bacterium]|nr:ATP-binding protein [bacterium]